MKTKNNFDLISQSVKSFTSAISAEDEKQMAYDNMVDAEIDDAKEEKLEAEAKEQTEQANEEFSIAQQEDEAKWGPDNIERN